MRLSNDARNNLKLQGSFKNGNKWAKKVIRDTCQSITYYLPKYHVILCEVIRDTFFALFRASASDFTRHFFD